MWIEKKESFQIKLKHNQTHELNNQLDNQYNEMKKEDEEVRKYSN